MFIEATNSTLFVLIATCRCCEAVRRDCFCLRVGQISFRRSDSSSSLMTMCKIVRRQRDSPAKVADRWGCASAIGSLAVSTSACSAAAICTTRLRKLSRRRSAVPFARTKECLARLPSGPLITLCTSGRLVLTYPNRKHRMIFRLSAMVACWSTEHGS